LSGPHLRTAILADDSVAVFNEITQHMVSMNRTAAYLWFRHEDGIDRAQLAHELAARSGVPLSHAQQSVDEHIAKWEAAGLVAPCRVIGPKGAAPFGDVASRASRVQSPAPTSAELGRGVNRLTGQLAGLNFLVRYEPDELRELIHPPLEHLIGRASDPVDLIIDVLAGETGWTVLDGAGVLGRDLQVNELMPAVIQSLVRGVLDRGRYAIAFHASAVRRNGRCILMPASSGAGKSTLCAALLDSGFEFVSDDVVLLDGTGPGLRGMPLPLGLKEGSWPVLQTRFPSMGALKVHVRPDGKLVKYLAPPLLAPAGYSHSAGWMIFPNFKSNADVELHDLDQSTALFRLISEAFAPSLRLNSAVFELLVEFMRPLSCRRLTYPSLELAVALIDRTCE
jgi:Coenzyme PQQ synthesis protein D (PqqD)